MKILLVTEDFSISLMLNKMKLSAGKDWDIITIQTPAEALSKLKSESGISLVLTTIQFFSKEKVSGYDLLTLIKAEFPQMPVIGLVTNRHEKKNYDFDYFQVLPVKRDSLFENIEKLAIKYY